jgi:hypothetical protein
MNEVHPTWNHGCRTTHQHEGSSRRGRLERLPKWLICIPIGLQWIALGLRYRSFGLPSAANPDITAGGLVGEGKHEYFQQMGADAQAATAAWIKITTGSGCTPVLLEPQLLAAGLDFPLILKPNLGLCGHGVRRVDDLAALCRDLARFDPQVAVIVQQYLPQTGEAGIFYVRHPDHATGRILGMALRHFPRVVGDGQRSLAELMAADSRSGQLLATADHEFALDPRSIPARGEVVRLSTIGSTRVGSCYTDGGDWVTPALTAAIERIAQQMPAFYFGRFDLRFDSLALLQAGQGLHIMEVNGAGSEAIHAWDPQWSLRQAFGFILHKQALLFDIAAANRARGHRVTSLWQILALNRQQQRLLRRYPPSN